MPKKWVQYWILVVHSFWRCLGCPWTVGAQNDCHSIDGWFQSFYTTSVVNPMPHWLHKPPQSHHHHHQFHGFCRHHPQVCWWQPGKIPNMDEIFISCHEMPWNHMSYGILMESQFFPAFSDDNLNGGSEHS